MAAMNLHRLCGRWPNWSAEDRLGRTVEIYTRYGLLRVSVEGEPDKTYEDDSLWGVVGPAEVTARLESHGYLLWSMGKD